MVVMVAGHYGTSLINIPVREGGLKMVTIFMFIQIKEFALRILVFDAHRSAFFSRMA
jgi:hypothetical protein